MITLLMGHRGSGKTALLQRIKLYLPSVDVIDLDHHIELQEGTSINEIFVSKGEKEFRKLELRSFERLIYQERSQPLYIAVGAGFQGELPRGVRRLWVRRDTDHFGRVLLDRPRLEEQKSQYDSYHERFREREELYRFGSHEVVTIREGFNRPHPVEEAYFTHRLRDVGGIMTLLPEQYAAAYTWYWFIGKRLGWGIDAFEIRDDLLSGEQIARVLESVPVGKILYSYRPQASSHLINPPQGMRWDWALELGPCPFGIPPIVSVHEKYVGEALSDVLARIEHTAAGKSHCKVAVNVHSFAELSEGDRWARADPAMRSFLPRSSDGRWSWYRRLQKGRCRINFFREGKGTGLDQPPLFDWVGTPSAPQAFAAVLGDPVVHSYTPAVHADFFSERKIPVFSLRVTEEDWKAGALEHLQQLGLRYAAVTSPLKQLAFTACRCVSSVAERYQCVNTLFWDDEKKVWCGTNTDLHGLKTLVATLSPYDDVAVWGGGALVPILRDVLPSASFYAARSGELRYGKGVNAPHVLLWATGHHGVVPPPSLRPRHVVDLHYHQSSPGLCYAEAQGIPYTPGALMFHKQAEEQRTFWEEYER